MNTTQTVSPDQITVRKVAEIVYGPGTPEEKHAALREVTDLEVYVSVMNTADKKGRVVYSFEQMSDELIPCPVRYANA